MREVVVHGSLPHLQGELGLPLPLRGPDLPMLQIVLVPGPERMPRRVPQLRNRVCVAMIESDEGLDCDPSLFGAEHAASFLSRFGPRFPPQSLRTSSYCTSTVCAEQDEDWSSRRYISPESMLRLAEPAEPEPVESEASRRRGLMIVETAMELAGTGRRAA